MGKKLPDWAKWAIIGVMLQGGLQELNTLTGGKTGQIGNVDTAELDEQMRRAVEDIKNGMNGTQNQLQGVTDEYPSSVAGVTDQYPSSVAGYLDAQWGGTVAGWENW